MSYEKLVIDLEIIGMVRKFINGLTVTDETLALDIIEEVGIGGHFLGHEHTMINCRKEPFLPEISLRGKLMNDPDKTILENINSKVKIMLAQYQKPELPQELDKNIVDFLVSKGYDPRPYI